MRFSTFAGLAIVPTLARVVLGAAFIVAGYTKVFVTTDFTAEQAATLEQREVFLQKKVAVPDEGAQARLGGAAVHLASWSPQDEEPPQDEEGEVEQAAEQAAEEVAEETEAALDDAAEAAQDAGSDLQEAAEEVVDDAKAAADRLAEDIGLADPDDATTIEPGEMYEGMGLYHLALTLEEAQWSHPVKLAWLAALTELIGGVLVLIGLFSRVWGLALAGVMAVAFYMTTWPVLGTEPSLLGVPLPPTPAYKVMFLQLGLFVLAFGLFLTGPGPLSIDRLMFGRREPRRSVRLIEDDDDI